MVYSLHDRGLAMSDVNGFLNLNKPPGKSSFALVSLVRRLTGLRRVGHGGTLDPAAEGVLPVCLGQGTRMSEHLLTARKRYSATVRLGITTDTYDAEGLVLQERDSSGIGRRQVSEALRRFRGRIQQLPPMYSALKHQGKPLYKLARAGVEVEREPREVEIYRLKLTGWKPPSFSLEVECGRGTYIRSLAHDLGQALGCGAHLQGLVRTMVGSFTLQDALSVEALFDSVHGGYWQQHLYPMDWVVPDMAAAILDADSQRAVQDGKFLPHDGDSGFSARNPVPRELCRAYTVGGELLALLRYEGERQGWQPSRVFSRSG